LRGLCANPTSPVAAMPTTVQAAVKYNKV